MSIFATIAIVCTMATCSDYVVDHSQNVADANVNTYNIGEEFNSIWEDEQKLTNWLTEHQIGETVFEIVSLEFETKEIKEDDLP